MERQIGEKFKIELLVKVVESDKSCEGCIFSDSEMCVSMDELGTCDYLTRSDGKNVHFEIVSCNNI